MTDLFEALDPPQVPLAERMRPRTLAEVAGQDAVVDILRDKSNLEFKRDSEAKIVIKNGELSIERFYPMSLLQKLSLQKESAGDWREQLRDDVRRLVAQTLELAPERLNDETNLEDAVSTMYEAVCIGAKPDSIAPMVYGVIR